MTPDRYKELCQPNAKVTKEEWEAGWHFCPDWDHMLVNSNDVTGEGSCCTCEHRPYPEGDYYATIRC